MLNTNTQNEYGESIIIIYIGNKYYFNCNYIDGFGLIGGRRGWWSSTASVDILVGDGTNCIWESIVM
jgi:hypothetical protein